MGLLAADRKKQRWSGDPRGKSWSENKNKISNKMMEKMGWKDGEGLGADGQGMLNVSIQMVIYTKLDRPIQPIGIKYKMDNLGFGCTQKYDKQWIEHQDSFNDLLAGLNQATGKSYTDFHEPWSDPIDKVGCVVPIVMTIEKTHPTLR